MERRRRGTGLTLIWTTIRRSLGMLDDNGLGRLIPFTVLLFVTALLLYFLNGISPLAPFVYSLF